MAQGRPLVKIKFHSIMRDIKDDFGSAEQIATRHSVSTETVRAVRRAKTWPGFEQAKKDRSRRALEQKIALGKSRAANPGAQPADKKTPDDTLQLALDTVPNKPLTPPYVEELLEGQRQVRLSNELIVTRLDNLTKRINGLTVVIEKIRAPLTSIRNFKARGGFWNRG